MYGYRTGYSVPARPRTAFSPLLLPEVAEMWDPAHGLDLVTGNRVRAWTGRKTGRTVQQLATQQQPVWSATAMGGQHWLGAMSYIVFVNGLLGDVAAAEMLTWALARRNL